MKEVLLTTIAYSPNIGGIETHFDDLTKVLLKKGWKVDVLTYKPITTKASAPFIEKSGNLTIYRIPWFGGVFYNLVNNPILEFMYLIPGLFLFIPVLLIKEKNISVIHSHGLIAGFAAVFWSKVFSKKVITTTHSIYNFPKAGLYHIFAKWIFNKSDKILVLSKQSAEEIKSLGIDNIKIQEFTYWVDLDKFKATSNKRQVKKQIGWEDKFIVLFVGRLVLEKGINELLEAAKIWDKNITLTIIGTGPMENTISNFQRFDKLTVPSEVDGFPISNVQYLGKIDNVELPKYYNAADVLIVPSVHEEGFGRVILESLACGTPVIGSNRGAIPEAIDQSVGKLIDVTPEKIKESAEYFYKNPDKLKKLSDNARKFAEKKYSEVNADVIISTYIK